MSFTKTKIYNLACSALLLSREISDTETDRITNEVRVLNTFWDDALTSTLQELDLDSLSESLSLEMIATIDGPWSFVYKYPSRCAFLRRIESGAITDSRSTHIAKKIGIYNGHKAIFTNEYAATAECITKDVELNVLSSPAGFALAHKLAFLASPLLVGKGAKTLRDEIYQKYLMFLNDARNLDSNENFNYDDIATRSEFVAARLE
jgi:hypothetical protein